MITNYETTNVLNAQIMGLSTDTKPTAGVQPNSLFWELDTNGMYFFDGTQWQPIGGSGGGGESDFSTAQVSFAGNWLNTGLIPIGIDTTYDYITAVPTNGQQTLILYKGEQYLYASTECEITATGNITVQHNAESQEYTITITGDGTLTIETSVE